MTALTATRRRWGADPLRLGQSVGAALAFCAVARSRPLLFGQQGCAAVVAGGLSQHFRRPVPVHAISMNEIDTVFGATGAVDGAMLDLFDRHRPDLVGVVSSSLSQTRGDDFSGWAEAFRRRHGATRPAIARMEMLFVTAPDDAGSVQDGWGLAAEAMVAAFCRPAMRPGRGAGRIAILAGSHLTPGDVEALVDLVESFGFSAIVFPDIRLLAGREGTGIGALRALGAADLCLVVGWQMMTAARRLAAIAGTPCHLVETIYGLEATDALVDRLSTLSGLGPPPVLARQRRALVAAMAEARPLFRRHRLAAAAEPDLLAALSAWGQGVGIAGIDGVTTGPCPMVARGKAVIGDMEDLRQAAKGADLILGPAPAGRVAREMARPSWRCGYFCPDRLDVAARTGVGYAGGLALLASLGNALLGDGS